MKYITQIIMTKKIDKIAKTGIDLTDFYNRDDDELEYYRRISDLRR